jgi:hypothetical protein
LRRTITTRNRFITSTTNWWANFRWAKPGIFALAILVLLSCEDDTGAVGFKNPNGDFQVFVKEFTIPSKTFLMDSVSTSYGYATSPAVGTKTVAPHRFMVGHAEDPVFGKTTATAYTQFWASTFPTFGNNPRFLKLTMKLVFDYYWSGATTASKQTFEVYELTDSVLTYIPHYINEAQNIGQLLGSATYEIDPTVFDENIIENRNPDVNQHVADTLKIVLNDVYGLRLLNLAMDTIGNNEANYDLFYKLRRKFKGFALKSPNSDKIVGFDIENAKTEMVLDYKVDTTTYQLHFSFSAPGQANRTKEFMSYTQLETDRSGTPLAGLNTKYQDFEAPTGLRYVQAGTGITTKLDFSEVADYFKDIPIKALSVAELRIETDEQKYAPYSFLLRVIKPNNREVSTSTQILDLTGDPVDAINADFALRQHQFSSRADGGLSSPSYKAEVLGDDKNVFLLSQASNSGTAIYKGYMTNYLQTELGLSETDFLRYYEIIPYAASVPSDKINYAPAMTRSVNGFYFSPDKVTLKVYYTTPRAKH